jgi:hypothetical protein
MEERSSLYNKQVIIDWQETEYGFTFTEAVCDIIKNNGIIQSITPTKFSGKGKIKRALIIYKNKRK